jgi:hypothetical protein
LTRTNTFSQAPAAALCAAAGAAVGVAGAFAYYSPALRPLAHILGPWLLLTALVSAGRPLRQAVLFATTALAAAVPAFYVGKALVHAIHHTGLGRVDIDTMLLWLGLALLAGPLLAAAAHRIGTPDRAAALAAGATAGLLIADTARRALDYTNQAPVLLVFLALALTALWLRARPLAREHRIAAATALLASVACGYLLVSAPDLLEDLVR